MRVRGYAPETSARMRKLVSCGAAGWLPIGSSLTLKSSKIRSLTRHSECLAPVQAVPDRVKRPAVGTHARQRVRRGVDQARIGVSEAQRMVVAGSRRPRAQARLQVLLPGFLEDPMHRSDLEAPFYARVGPVVPVGAPLRHGESPSPAPVRVPICPSCGLRRPGSVRDPAASSWLPRPPL